MQLNGYPSLGCGPGILAKLALTPAQGASAGLAPAAWPGSGYRTG